MKIKTRRYYLYYLAKVGGLLISILPLKVGLFLAGLTGKATFAVLPKARRETLDNLKNAFPEKKDTEIERIAKEVFSNLCKNAVEMASYRKLTSRTLDRWVVSDGAYEKIDRALSKGKGVIMLASHFGNWELISAYFTLKGYRGTVIARRIYFYKYDEFINRLRSYVGVGVVYRDDSPKKILKVLKKNEMLGVLADQDVDSVDGVFVDFFGRPAYTPKAPVALALASGAPLIPCFMIREKNHHRLVLEDPIELEEKSDKEETIKFNTQKWSCVIESYIKRYPEQWVWMHRRWKTKPENQD
ncbi:MAG: lysophospholipid acyltransferase family protein [Candidatus Omnitrophota bacterium]